MKTEILNLSEEEYRQLPCPSVTDIIKYMRAPSDYYYYATRVAGQKTTEAMMMGKVLDYMVRYGRMPELILSDAKTYDSQKHRDCMLEKGHDEQRGVFVLTEEMLNKAEGMWHSIGTHEDVLKVAHNSQRQVQVLRRDNEGNPIIKGMADLFYVEQKRVIDVKKIDRLSSWRYRSEDMGYWYQVAAYMGLLNEAFGAPEVTSAGFIVVEDHYPYEVLLPFKTIDQLSQLFLEVEIAYIRLLNLNPKRRTTWTIQ